LRAIIWQYERDTNTNTDPSFSGATTAAAVNDVVDPIAKSVAVAGFAQDVDSNQLGHYGSSSFHPFYADSRQESNVPCSNDRSGPLSSSMALQVSLSDDVHAELFDLFFRHVNDYTTFLDRAEFERDRLAHSGRSADVVSSNYSHLLHLAIFAIASHLSPRIELRADVDDPSTAGAGFLNEALSILADELLAPPKLTTALALTLLCSALADRGYDSAAWIHCGTAIRMVQHLGLHLVNPEAGCNASQRNRVIWSVFLSDK
jgi:hypothetical protein